MTTDILLDAGTAGSTTPSAKLTNPGASIVVGIVNVGNYQQTDFDSKEKLFWDAEKKEPKMGKVVTGLVVSATDTTVEVDDVERPAQPGDLVTFWMEGGRWFPYRDAVKASGGVNVGDVMRWARVADEAPKMKGGYPRKVYECAIRRPEAKDGDLADRCVAAYHEQAARPALDAPTEVQRESFAAGDPF